MLFRVFFTGTIALFVTSVLWQWMSNRTSNLASSSGSDPLTPSSSRLDSTDSSGPTDDDDPTWVRVVPEQGESVESYGARLEAIAYDRCKRLGCNCNVTIEACITRFGEVPFLIHVIASSSDHEKIERFGTSDMEAIADRIFSAHTSTWHEDNCALLLSANAPWN